MAIVVSKRMLTDPYSTAPAILLVGKTGAGKSTLANRLFGEDEKFFVSDRSESATQICQSDLLKLHDDKEYNIVDTPGLFDTKRPDDEVLDEIAQSIVQCSHGVAAILFVIEWGRYTAEQQITNDRVLKFLGQESYHHLIVVFTKCNKAQTKQRFKLEDNFDEKLKSFLEKVGYRWVVLPNLEIFDEPNDPVVKFHMDSLKNYIMLMPKPYTTELFNKVKDAREKELKQVKEREEVTGEIEVEERRKAGTEVAKKEVEDGGCFSLHSKVILADGKRIEISQLSIGDKVCCGEENGELIISEVYAIVHADEQAVTQYQRIDYRKTDGTEGVLRLTPKHHLFVSQGKTIFAEDVQAHVTELLLLDDKKLIPVIPHQVTKEWELGYIAPFTQNGKIVVDDLLCSCYAVAPPYQEIINFALIPFRLYSWMMPTTNYKKEIHPYLRFLQRGQSFLEQIGLLSDYPKL